MSALSPGFIVVCALLVLAGVAKLRSPSAASDALSSVALPASRPMVRILGLGELAVGALAAVHPTHLTAAVVAISYAGFCAFVLRARPASCGCFGAASSDTGSIHALLNATACIVAALAALLPPPGVASIARHGPLIAVSLGLGTVAATLAAYLAFTALPHAWHAYGVGQP